MKDEFNILNFKKNQSKTGQYDRQLSRLTSAGKSIDCIEQAVRDALQNLKGNDRKSFVIYGEPQSGKTEMMICLTAKLLDEGRHFILHLLNDSVDLLNQNLGRFQESGLAPSAQNFSEILNPEVVIGKSVHVIFCKKNGNDLTKLYNKIGKVKNIIVVDDEADFASPNSKINSGLKTPINKLISDILGPTGDYIGVTATPARLDLNNTFENDSQLWVNFPPHNAYTGQDVFFPIMPSALATEKLKYQLTLLDDKYDDPKFARQALFSFLVNVSYLNSIPNSPETNYSMLIHTSGKKVDHKTDWSVMQKTVASLCDRSGNIFDKYVKQIWHLAKDRYSDSDANKLTAYIVDNITRNAIIILNSDKDFLHHGNSATKPSSLFTIIIGGNIVSRGVTFDNLLSMYFTRDVKHKIQQDTYIQRARMFGARQPYLRYFELTIPQHLYADWHRCFVFHRLALAAIKNGKGSPVWLSDHRIAAVSGASIDRSTVDIDSGEMSFPIFKLPENIDRILEAVQSNHDKLQKLTGLIGEAAFPNYLKQFIIQTSTNVDLNVDILPSSNIDNYNDADGLDKESIQRRRGFFGNPQKSKKPGVIHHLKIFFYSKTNDARLFYKFDGSIQFIKNAK